MSGGPADLPALMEEVRDMADRGGRMLMMAMLELIQTPTTLVFLQRLMMFVFIRLLTSE